MAGAYLTTASVICPIGMGPAQLAASFRAGMSRFAQSSVMDRWFEPVVAALLPEDALPPLLDELSAEPLRSRERRMLRLAAGALRDALAAAPAPQAVPVLLALPERHPQIELEPVADGFLARLALQAGVSFDQGESRTFAAGRAGGMLALEAGLEAIAKGKPYVLVGGVDTHLDLRLLATLGQEQRILGPRVMDGFVPGEAAAFVLLARKPAAEDSTPIVLNAVGIARDLGHRYGTEPARGEGLAHAIEALLERLPEPAPVETCFAGLNGESFGAKEWGVARVRHRELFSQTMAIEHPADCFGDVGAAMATTLLALASECLCRGYRRGPMLLWASSDGPDSGCAYLSGA